MAVSIKAGELVGMVTDLIRTASKEVHLPVLHGVHLYTTTGPGGTVLVGESSTRFVAGQVRELVEEGGELAPVVLGLPEVKAALTLVKGLPEVFPVVLAMSGDLLVVESVGLRAEYPTVRGEFPNLQGLHEAVVETDRVALSDAVLAPVVAVAKRRGVPMRLVFSGRLTAVQVHVGDNYQALVMPVRDATVDPTPMWAPPVEAADVVAA